MSNHSGSRRLHAAAWTVLILAQLVAWRGDAGFEHLGELIEHLDGDGRPLWTGGSWGYLLPFAAARAAGLAWWALGAVHLALGAATLAAWQRWAPALVGARPAAWAGLAWAAWPVPWEHLVENSTLLAFYAPLAFLAAGGGAAGSRRAVLAASVTAGAVSASLLMLPTVVAAAAVGAMRRRFAVPGAMAAGAGLALLPLLLTGDESTGAVDWSLLGADPRSWVGAARWLSPATGLGLIGAAVLAQRGKDGRAGRALSEAEAARAALLWAAAGLAPAIAFGRTDGLEPFHLAAATPGVMVAIGLTAAAVEQRAAWAPGAVAAVLAMGWVGHTGPDFRGVEPGTRCAASDAGACGVRDLWGVVAALQDAGVDALAPEPLSFAGSYAPCLADMRSWARRPSAPELGPRVLLLPSDHPASGGLDAGALRAWPGASEVTVQRVDGGVRVDGPAVLFLEGGASAEAPERRCADRHPDAAAALRQGSSVFASEAGTVGLAPWPDAIFVTRLPDG